MVNRMVQDPGRQLDHVFSALRDPTRRAILVQLRGASATMTELSAPFRMSLTAVSKHVRVLERAGLVRRQVRGREHHCRLNPGPLRQASRWMEDYRAFWEGRLDALQGFLANKPSRPRPRKS
jgi:DNA-binding transcriptional ArsR family regulator